MSSVLARFLSVCPLALLVLGLALAVLPPDPARAAPQDTPPCVPDSVTYTLDGEFGLGTLSGVVAVGDQLELDSVPTTWPYAWIANSIEGTLSKVDTQTGREVARYYTGPPNGNDFSYLAPSRTVVDADGNCWVANRTAGAFKPTITQILITGGIDRNNNNILETSSDLNNNGIIDPSEILPWGQDERVARHYALGSTTNNQARGMTLDKTGFLWVGLTVSQEIMKIDPGLSTVTYAPTNVSVTAPALVNLVIPGNAYAYGMALSPNGLIYISTQGPKAIQLDPGLASGGTGAGPAFTETINHDGANYGIAVDQNCIVWLALAASPDGNAGVVRWDPPLTLGNPLQGWTYNAGTVGYPARGITVDFNGNVWMALNGPQDAIIEFGPGPNPPILNGPIPVGVPTPCGLGIASDGGLIVTPNGGSNWEKRDVTTGANIPLPGPQLAGPGPYTYSDFTGSQLAMNGLLQGTWAVITDGGSAQTAWNFIGWNQSTPPSTSVQVEYRVAQTLPALALANWTVIGAPGNPGPVLGRYIETRVRLQRVRENCNDPFVTPVLYDLTVTSECVPCGFSACPPDTVVPCLIPEGAEFFYDAPTLTGCDTTFVVTCSPPPGFFPVGPTAVTCTAVNAYGDTLTCTFTVTVTGDCDPDPLGACCNGTTCTLATEHDCLLQGGIYFGDDTNCVGGCNANCLHAPSTLRTWLAFDGAVGGVTPNRATPAAGGLLVNAPTATPDGMVGGAYLFDGATQAVEVPSHPSLDPGEHDFSIDLWLLTTQAVGTATLLDRQGGAPPAGYALFLEDGFPGLRLATGGAFTTFQLVDDGAGTGFVADGSWHLLAVTVDRDAPDGVRFLVDGNPVGPTFDPTAFAGSLDSTEPLRIARENPALGGGRFAGVLDEIEIFRKALSVDDVAAIWNAGSGGKCPEACIVTRNVPCCGSLSGASAITLCNYDNVPHTYSWGATPINGGAGCAPSGPIGFSPPGGTVTVPGGGCVSIPLAVACPSTVPPGQVACYQVSVFNHDTGRIFGCQGSVRRVPKWCAVVDPIGVDPIGVLELQTGVATLVRFTVESLAEGGSPELMAWSVEAREGDTEDPSTTVTLDGLAPGDPVTGDLLLAPGGSGEVAVQVLYDAPWLIGHDRLVLRADEDGDGTPEILGEVALRSLDSSALAVDPSGTGNDGRAADRLFLSLPNPFRASQRIVFRVEGAGPQPVSLALFDIQGRRIKSFPLAGTLPPGEHTVKWDVRNDAGVRIATGIYFLRLEVGSRQETVKVLVRP